MSAAQIDIAIVTLTIELAIAFVGSCRVVLARPSRQFRLNLS